METIKVHRDTKRRLWVLMVKKGFNDFDEALKYLLDMYERSTRDNLSDTALLRKFDMLY